MLKQLVYGVLGVGSVGALSICGLCGPKTAAAQPAVIAAMATPAGSALATPATDFPAAAVKTVRLKVAGMTCAGCVLGTRTVLTRLPGVTKADVSYPRQEAVVTYDPAKVTVAQMVAAIKTLGYTATLAAG